MQYNALTQTTIKTVAESTVNTTSDITIPTAPVLGRCRMEAVDSSGNITPFYITLYAFNTSTNITNFTIYTYGRGTQATACFPQLSSVVIDNVIYYGLKNAYYGYLELKGTNLFTPSPSHYYFSAGRCKVIKYDSNSNLIVTNEYSFERTIAAHNDSNSSYSYAINYFQFPKVTNDLILSITFEYDD